MNCPSVADRHRRPVIFLIGLPGSGKSTLGRALQGAGIADFVDLDSAIEARAGMSVAQIFAAEGEASFRRIETQTLADIITRAAADDDRQPRLLAVACGGGTPCFGDNMDRMLAAGTVVELQASRDILIARLIEAGDSRPLLAGLDAGAVGRYIDRTAAARKPYYSRAHAAFDSSRLDTAAEIAESVELFRSFITSLQGQK